MVCLLWAFKESGEASRMSKLLQYREKRSHALWVELMGFRTGQHGWEYPRNIQKFILRSMHGSKAVLKLSVQHIPMADTENKDRSLQES